MNLGLKISLVGAYGLSAVFVLASIYWETHTGLGGIIGDPYLDWAVFFGIAGLVLTFVNIIIDKI